MFWPSNLQNTNQLQKSHTQDYINFTGKKKFYLKDKS